jgi:hypothetical protein
MFSVSIGMHDRISSDESSVSKTRRIATAHTALSLISGSASEPAGTRNAAINRIFALAYVK